ncbi:MAG: Tyrosine phosphatase family, partial [Trebonia sp.]|nr:Tyrosine phosphatase family [Trebonia sp.]
MRHRRRESRCRLSGRHRVPDVRGGARPPDRFAGALNFRDIGGYPVAGVSVTRWCAVYRSDSLHYLTDGDLAAFDAPGVKA